MNRRQPGASTQRELRRTLRGLAFCSPWIIGFLLFSVFPILSSLYFSFHDYSVLQPPSWTGLSNYVNLLTDDSLFWKSLGNTLFYAIGATLIGGVLAISLALLLNSNVRGLAVYRTIFYVPVIVPVVASTIIWLWLFNPQIGLLNYLFSFLGIPPIPWLTDPRWSKPALILMSLWGVGNSVVIFLAGLQDIPRELYEAAELDGASSWQKTRFVTLPMLSSVVFFNLIIGLIAGFQVFTQAYVMTSGGPADSTLFYALYLYNNAFQFFKMGYASAQAWILFLLIVACTAFIFRTSSRWVYYAGR
ncbi:MAG: spermidine/putrescine ABC transporter permease [Candidatus Roseilinea sp.]|nr:MAG: spermidine/putrescine ABC transporter permease [Candidatus Roseilinea sp.]